MTLLQRAQKIQKNAPKQDLTGLNYHRQWIKFHEEIEKVLAEINVAEPNQQAVEEEIGDLLFAVVNLARHTSVDAETALIKANQKFEKRFRQVEQVIDKQGLSMESANLVQMEAAWQQECKQKQLINRRKITDFHSFKNIKKVNMENMSHHVFSFYEK